MSYGLERLKEIGAQKIHEKTHISREHVQAILHESFDSLNKIHFIGFISILEREYNVDLSELKAKGLAYFRDLNNKPRYINNTVFAQGKKKKNHTTLYVIVALLLLGGFAYFKMLPAMDESNESKQIDNTLIENAQKSIESVVEIDVQDANETEEKDVENNASNTLLKEDEQAETSQVEEEKTNTSKNEVQKSEAQERAKSLIIIPKAKVWMGYIDLKTDLKSQKSFEDELSLDANKDWLFLFGHGNVSVEVHGVLKEFSSRKNVRFKYVDGNFSEVSAEEFTKLSKDRKW